MSGRVPINATTTKDIKQIGKKGNTPVPAPKECKKNSKPIVLGGRDKHESGWV